MAFNSFQPAIFPGLGRRSRPLQQFNTARILHVLCVLVAPLASLALLSQLTSSPRTYMMARGGPQPMPGRIAQIQEEQAATAAALRREKAILAQERERLERAAQTLSESEASLRNRGGSERRAAAVQRKQAEMAAELKREKARLAQERERLERAAKVLSEHGAASRKPVAREEHTVRIQQEQAQMAAALKREKAVLAKERARLERAALTVPENEISSRNQGGVSRAAEHRFAQKMSQLRKYESNIESEKASLRIERQSLAEERQRLAEEAEQLDTKRHALQQRSSNAGSPYPSEELRAELAAARERLARQASEFQNFRARIASQEKEQAASGLAKLAKPLLPLLDDMNRAIANSGDGVVEILAPLRRKFLNTVEGELNVKEMSSTVGKPFDPMLHDAVSVMASDSPPDIILHELEQGFVGGDGSVIRPAKVVVSSGDNN